MLSLSFSFSSPPFFQVKGRDFFVWESVGSGGERVLIFLFYRDLLLVVEIFLQLSVHVLDLSLANSQARMKMHHGHSFTIIKVKSFANGNGI